MRLIVFFFALKNNIYSIKSIIIIEFQHIAIHPQWPLMIILERRKTKILKDRFGAVRSLDVLFVDGRPLLPQINYVLDMRISPASNVKLIQAVSMLLEYMDANHSYYESAVGLFRGFVNAVYDGTRDKHGFDPTGLFWSARSIKAANGIIENINKFANYCSIQNGAEPLNPWRESTLPEQQLAWAAWQHKKNNSFLKHTYSGGAFKRFSEGSRTVSSKTAPNFDAYSGVKHFPDKYLKDLIFNGFVRPGRQTNSNFESSHNLRDILILLLMNAGGMRVSEVFHLYVHDVIENPTKENVAYVRVFHPSDGLAPEMVCDAKTGVSRRTVRSEYLRSKFGLLPRSELPSGDRYHAGWKSLMLDDASTSSVTVQWFPLEAGKMFWQLWQAYLVQRALLPESCKHPFAFVGNNGQMYSIDSFNRNYARACKRAGISVSKHLGTNPHGHRHAYGQRLAVCGASQLVIKKAMHHKSLNSQIVYTAPTNERLAQELLELQMSLEVKRKGVVTDKDVKFMLEKLNDSASASFNFETLGWKPLW